MKTSLQNTLEDIKSKEDKDSDIPASRRTRRKLHLDDLLDKFEKASKHSTQFRRQRMAGLQGTALKTPRALDAVQAFSLNVLLAISRISPACGSLSNYLN